MLPVLIITIIFFGIGGWITWDLDLDTRDFVFACLAFICLGIAWDGLVSLITQDYKKETSCIVHQEKLYCREDKP